MANEPTALAVAFRKAIATQTVWIEKFYEDQDGNPMQSSASGVVIGRGKTDGTEHVNIATAAHVITDTPTKRIRWFICRMEIDEHGEKTEVRVAEFHTQKPICQERWRFYRPKDWKASDIGMIRVFNKAKLQGETSPEDRLFIDFNDHPPLKLTGRKGHLLAGTKVAWAGFPGFVNEAFGSYHLCYYEGVVSAHVSGVREPRRPRYLIDGHVARGVSGGPIWFCTTDNSPIILGVVSGYGSESGSDMPGLSTFSSMNVLLDNFERDKSRSS